MVTQILKLCFKISLICEYIMAKIIRSERLDCFDSIGVQSPTLAVTKFALLHHLLTSLPQNQEEKLITSLLATEPHDIVDVSFSHSE